MVRRGLGLDDLQVAYQPIVDVRTGSIFAYEALLRSSDARFVSPPKVIAQSIDKELCGELGRVVRELAIEGCRHHPLFMNIHPREFDDGWIVRPDDPVFRHPHSVFIEVTESVPLSHENHCRGVLAEIRDKGIQLAVDDLGAGYSNLMYIADLVPDIVKLDREMVRSVARGQRAHRFLKQVVSLCHEMGARVVAEGVETEDELRGAREAGADFVQGFLIAGPEARPHQPDVARFT